LLIELQKIGSKRHRHPRAKPQIAVLIDGSQHIIGYRLVPVQEFRLGGTTELQG
jgi:hypothetical protein